MIGDGELHLKLSKNSAVAELPEPNTKSCLIGYHHKLLSGDLSLDEDLLAKRVAMTFDISRLK